MTEYMRSRSLRGCASMFCLALSVIATGCGGGSTFNVQNPPPPPISNSVAIVFQPAPPASITISSPVNLSAVVNNDASNSGVDWSLSCPKAGQCGSLNPSHTPSGQATTYTPPSILSSNNQDVSIVAFASADHTKNVMAQIAVTAFANVLSGAYVLQTNGVDISGLPYQRAGVLMLDGNGEITGGERTVNFNDPNVGVLSSTIDAVTGGSYFIGADGRGSLAFTTANTSVGQNGTETFSVVVLSNAHVLLTKTDDSNLQGSSGESSTGTMDLQTVVTPPTAGYAFAARGSDAFGSALAMGGVLNIDSPNSISGTGSAFDFAFNDASGTVIPSSSVSGTVSTPDAFGQLQIDLSTDFGFIELTGYVIDSTHIALIETDDISGGGFAVVTGPAIGQGAATGTFLQNTFFKGPFAFGILGDDFTGVPSSLTSVLTSAGRFTAVPATATLTQGFMDEMQVGTLIQVSDKFHGTWTLDPSGSGRVDTNSSITFAHVVNGTGPELVFYLTGNGNPVLILDADIEPGLGGGGVGAGIAYPMTAGASLSGSYGLTFVQNFSGNDASGSGEMSADSASQTLTGVVDTNSGFIALLDTPLSGDFQATTTSGRLTGTLSNPLFFSSSIGVDFFVIDSTHGLFVETDGGPAGANPGSLSFGFFSTRTPVCQGCP